MRSLSNLEVKFVGGGNDDDVQIIEIKASDSTWYEDLWDGVKSIFSSIGDFFTESGPEAGCDVLDKIGGNGVCQAGVDSLKNQQDIRELAICEATESDCTHLLQGK